ncbi:MMPL family transporter [Kineococcus gynurae]|uniref:MMPL family transporter n=1 Tax=Kineococcus gynurae TaxID=452979 RepID=A0ABV5LQ10_9ACTN
MTRHRVETPGRSPFGPVGRLVTHRLGAWLTIAAGLLVAVGIALSAGTAPAGQASATGLPDSAEAAKVAALQAQLPGAEVSPAVAVFSSTTALTPQDLQVLAAARDRVGGLATGGEVGPLIPSADGLAALLPIPLDTRVSLDQQTEEVTQIRAALREDLPAGVQVQVTGGPAFGADIAGSFSGADTRLLLVTVAVVALLLLITYRSPVLWLVPLAVVGIADRTVLALLTLIARVTDEPLDPSVGGITSVLVFGAGTNYALLLIARYREELRRSDDARAAMRRALRGAGPAIAASASTVVLALLTLQFALSPSNRVLGTAAALGIVVAGLGALLVLPAALVVCGRRLFWPFVPHVGSADTARTGAWSKIANRVVTRPVPVVVGSVVLIGALAAGLVGAKLGLSQTEQFRVKAESVEATATLAQHFPDAAGQPAAILTTETQADAVVAAAQAVPGVESAAVSVTGGGRAQVDAVLTAEPETAAARDTVERLRNAVHAVPGADALVGGPDAVALDARDTAVRDLRVIAPLIVGVVLVVLLVLLRALVAPIVLVLTVLATYLASLGAANLLFTRVFDVPALDTPVPLLSFLFLVALGVDYNIFLVTRAREETLGHGTREGMKIAVAVTGGVITSAGVLLAAVFTVLGVLPLMTLTQIGVIVGIGVLLDTLLVRTVLVPAIVSLLDRRTWWPSRLAVRSAAGS